MRGYGPPFVPMRNDALPLQDLFRRLREMWADVLPRLPTAMQVRRGIIELPGGVINRMDHHRSNPYKPFSLVVSIYRQAGKKYDSTLRLDLAARRGGPSPKRPVRRAEGRNYLGFCPRFQSTI